MERHPISLTGRQQLLDGRLRQRIERLARRYPRRRSALLSSLDLLYRSGGRVLAPPEVAEVASLLGMNAVEAWSAATSYPLFEAGAAGRWHIELDDGVSAFLSGSDDIKSRLSGLLGVGPGETTPDGLFSFSLSRDLGAADAAPAIGVADRRFGPMDSNGTDAFVASLRGGLLPREPRPWRTWSSCSLLIDGDTAAFPADLAAYRSRGGYEALAMARRLGGRRTTDAVARSGLRGRGGADFPADAKWRSAGTGRPVYLVCNADEGEPGTFKDRYLIEERPHLVLEGIAIAARAIGADTCFVYLRGTYRRGGAILEEAVAAAREAGLLDGLSVLVNFGAGSYICGEETALIASLEGRRGVPSSKPPYPSERGLYGRPTVVNNVETLASLPLILGGGPARFRRHSPRLFSLSGHVRRPGLYECSEGTPLSALLEAAGGVTGPLKGLFIGGISQPAITAAEADGLTLDRKSCGSRGASLGTGTVIVMNKGARLAEIAWRIADFFAAESCGQCTPCRDGLARIRDGLHSRRHGGAKGESIEGIRSIGRALQGLSFCPAGGWSLRSLVSLTEKFPRDFP